MKSKINSNFAIKLFPLAVLVALLAGGCGKHSAADNTTPTSSVATPEAIANGAPPPTVNHGPVVAPVTVPQADASAMLAQLTEVVRRYSVEHRRVPQSLDEVVAARYLTGLPAAPSGKKFVIDKKTLQVSLANN